jgi:Galactose oxidase, central domain
MHHTLLAIAATLAATASPVAAQWLQRSPTTSPSARSGAAMDYVPLNNGLVMFGGSAPGLNNQTWVYDGTDWTQLTPANAPSGRFGAQLVYDQARGVAVLHGGLASAISIPPPSSETWEWDGTTWTLAAPTASAGPRYRYAACYDSIRGRIVMHGGATSQLLGSLTNQTWEYTGTTWTQVTTVGNPGPRDRAAMCFAPALGRAVLFGGSNGSAFTNQTWLYDGVAATWTQVTITGPVPPSRSGATLVYDPLRNVCVLHGGQDASGSLGDTWTFDGTGWLQQPTTTQAVRDHVAAFLPGRNHVVKFGGFVAAPNTLSAETWEIGSGRYGRGCAGSSGVPLLDASTAPQAGQNWTLTVGNLNPTFNLAFLVFGLTVLPGVDLGLLNMPGCTGYTSPDLLISVNGAGGIASWTWSPVPAVSGATFAAQALCFDPSANAFGFTISNAVYGTITN